MSTQAPSKLRERIASPLTWHFVGAGVLALVTIVLGVRFAMDWAATSSSSAGELTSKQIQLKSLELETAPLRGLDQKVVDARKQIEDFYANRIPANYSSISLRIGELQVKSGVRLSRMQYTQGATNAGLTEITLDAGITGEYPQIMRFINDLERDKTFFVIKQTNLTSQQGGMVNLHLRLSTWLRPGDVPSGLAPTQPAATPAPAQPASAKEGE